MSCRRPGIARVLLITLALLLAPALAGGGDRGADGHFDQRGSSHFELLQDVDIDRYSGPRGSRAFERGVLEVLEGAYRRVGDTIGLRPRSKIRVLVYDSAVFEREFAQLFPFRAAGFYDGVIRVRARSDITPGLVSTLHHEYTHAAIEDAASGGLFPGWLNEGLAEYFENLAIGKRHLDPAQNALLVQMRESSQWLPLATLAAPSFAHMNGDSARLAYLESYAVVEHLIRRHGERRMRDLCEALIRTRSIERALDRTYRRSLAAIEADLLKELR